MTNRVVSKKTRPETGWATLLPLVLAAASLGMLISCSSPQLIEPSSDDVGGIPIEEPLAHRENYIEEANVVELSLAAQERAGIRVVPVTLGTIMANVVVPGTVKPIENRISHVRPLARGRVLDVFVNVGDRVQEGQTLAEFDNIEAGQLTAEYRAAEAELERLKVQHANADRQAERARSLVDVGAVPAKRAENMEADARSSSAAVASQEAVIAGLSERLRRLGASPRGEAEDSLTTILSPLTGVVIESQAAPGIVVDPSTLLFAVADLSRIYVEAQVYEKDLGRVRQGQDAFVRLDAFRDEMLEGRVAAIRDILDPTTRTASVRVELPNPNGRIKLEMFATVELPTTSEHEALTVPAEAVQTLSGRTVVFVQQDPLHFAAREVNALGEGDVVEIVSGLEPGEPVVEEGAFQVKSAFLAGQLEGEHEH